jgi:uncharacterized RDD family membrane protein YckC
MNEQANPYASPALTAEQLSAGADRQQGKIASQGKRLLNMIVDNIIIQVLSGGAGFVLGIVFVLTQGSADGTITSEDESVLQLWGFVVGVLVALGYYTLREALFQRTLAKLLTGTIVVTEQGSRPSFGQFLGRSLVRFIPFEAFSFLGGERPVGLHDKWSGTRVVETR